MIAITEKEFKQLTGYIHKNYGIHLKSEKQTMLVGRLHNVLIQEGFTSFTEYYDHLISNHSGEAVATLIEKITTNHTFFMREPAHFYYFRDKVLPYLANKVVDKDLRIWCAASSTGEEAYTIAMLLDEYFGKTKLFWDAKILATDISDKVLDIARKGIYSNERIASLPLSWRSNYFKSYDAENSVVIDRIRNEVIYRRFNLMDAVFPFKRKFHAIFCRNVMIYFDNKTKDELVNKLYDSLDHGGFLFIGHSETLNRGASRFKYIMPAVYRKE